jgi:hypothetical protein
MHRKAIMKKIFIALLLIILVPSCGTLRISEADRKLVSEGKKSLLVTQNPEPLYYLLVIPYILSKLAGGPIQVDIKEVDGKEVEEWFKANEEIALEPGWHEIVATYTVRSDRKLAPNSKSDTQSINYLFEGGKRYRIFLVEYLDHYKLRIEPY